MTKTQKALLACSAICYVLVLFSYFNSAVLMTVLFFILFTVTLLYFSYLSVHAGANPDYEDELEILRADYSRLVRENSDLMAQVENLLYDADPETGEINAQKNAAEDLPAAAAETDASAVEADAQAQDETESNADAAPADGFAGILPPAAETDGADSAPVNIIKIARDTLNEFLPFSEKAGILLQLSSPTDTILVKADVQRLRILFRNIIDNSIKYMNRAGSLIITLSMVGSDIFIVLKDNGDGLSESETPHIFEMNYQGSNRVSGNGLGLTQAKAIVEYYGGTIYARSKPGKGMGIYIQIPTD